jgi:glycosyltransferase involved in cell wall biosynthesis
MKISVVTAIYNREATIARAMESYQQQTWHDKEQVVVDGASKDRTMEIVRDFTDEKSIIVSERDNGIYDAINKGIALATGDVIGLLHSDDYFASATILTQIAKAFEDPDLDIVYADAGFFSPGQPDRITRRYNSGRFSASRIKNGWMPAHTTMYARRRVFEKYGNYSDQFKIAADFEFIARTFGSGAINSLYIPDIWMMMQTGGASTGGLKSKLVLNREVLKACSMNGIPSNYLRLLSKYPEKLFELFRR